METLTKEKIVGQVSIGKGWDNVKIITKGKFYNKIPDSEILETSNYDVFVLDKKNRPISDEKVLTFMKEFQAGHFFMNEFPVIVDKQNIILDGQHRFEACKRLGYAIYF